MFERGKDCHRALHERKRLRSGTKKPDKYREQREIEGKNGFKKSHSPMKDTTQRMMRQGMQREDRYRLDARISDWGGKNV